MNPSRRFTSAIGKFSDLTPSEYKRLYLNAKFTPANSASNGEHQRNHPHGGKRRLQESMSINWVDEGVVTPIRDQGWCGSCWAFSASAVIESNLLMYSDKEYSVNTLHLSEQQQVDCVTQSYGCDGGWSETSFEYAKQVGITRGSTYPYTGRNGNCGRNGGEYKISNYVHQNMTCEQLKEELQYGPINVAVNADDWDRIGDSIFPYQSASWNQLNHAVSLVGFQEAEGGNPAYWIIKNSWGIEWGDEGYGKLEYGPDGNSFGICMDTPFPII